MELVRKDSVALSQTNRYRIISIEAADIYRQEQENGVAVGIKMPERNSDARFRMFRNFLDNSLELIELEKAYKRICRNKILTENGEKSHLTGVHTSDDVWTKKLRCRCGYRMRRNKWRKNRNGELIYGYKCYASQE